MFINQNDILKTIETHKNWIIFYLSLIIFRIFIILKYLFFFNFYIIQKLSNFNFNIKYNNIYEFKTLFLFYKYLNTNHIFFHY